MFAVDSLLRQVTVRMQGDIRNFRIRSPAGALLWGSRVESRRGTALREFLHVTVLSPSKGYPRAQRRAQALWDTLVALGSSGW